MSLVQEYMPRVKGSLLGEKYDEKTREKVVSDKTVSGPRDHQHERHQISEITGAQLRGEEARRERGSKVRKQEPSGHLSWR